MGLGILCQTKIMIIKDLEGYQNYIDILIKQYPDKKILIAVYNCGINAGIYDAIAKCFRMMDILEKSPLHQYFWVTSNATGKSRV